MRQGEPLLEHAEGLHSEGMLQPVTTECSEGQIENGLLVLADLLGH